MSQSLAVATESTSIVQAPVEIVVNVDFAGNVTVDRPFVRVNEGATTTITWILISELSDVFFGHPAVTMFGEAAPATIRTEDPNVRTMEWQNTDPAKQKRSYYYRLHLVRRIGDTFVPLATDPIVHNDPPPGP